MAPNGLRIAIDGRPALWSRTGTGTIAHNVLRHIAMVEPQHQYFAYFDADPGQASAEYRRVVCRHGAARQKLWWANSYLRERAKADSIDVLVTFLDKEIPLLPTRCRIVSMIHDLIPLRFPDVVFRNPLHRLYYNTLIRLSARRSDLILTNSKFSRREIVQGLDVDSRKIRAIPLGVEIPPATSANSGVDVLRRYGVSKPYALALGSTEPRKNNRRVLEAARMLAHPGLQIVIVGSPWRDVQFEPGLIDDRVRLPGYVSEADLSALMASAEMLVFPSLHEGFGFPVLEAMSRGVPVITSNCTALPEVGGDAALYVNPCSVADIAEKMARVLCDSEAAAALRRKGRERARLFRWDHTCAEIVALCAALVQDRPAHRDHDAVLP